MKPIVLALLVCGTVTAQASENDLLQRALTCKLHDQELTSLIQDLAVRSTGFATPVARHGAPSFDVYRIAAPAKAFAYSSTEVVFMPGRVLLAVEGKTLRQAVMAHKLEQAAYSPASRSVRPTVSIVAFQLSGLPNKLLIGCAYASELAAGWVSDGDFFNSKLKDVDQN